MLRQVSKIEIKPVTGLSDFQSIDQRLKALILTTEGTLPGSRAFGIDPDCLDLSTKEAVNYLALELSEKAEIYVPEVTIMGVNSTDDNVGGMTTQIEIGRREEDD